MIDYSKNAPNQTCGYWLITSNNKHFLLKLISLNSGQLQNDNVNGAVKLLIPKYHPILP